MQYDIGLYAYIYIIYEIHIYVYIEIYVDICIQEIIQVTIKTSRNKINKLRGFNYTCPVAYVFFQLICSYFEVFKA